jgi:ribosomal protein S18 acetylase RimI-like enzyme
MDIRELTLDSEIAAAFPLMRQLRPHLVVDSFVVAVRQQQAGGYRLFGGWEGPQLFVLAGVRDARTLMRGPHLFVDDLVTDCAAQRKGHGAAMLRWLAEHARERGFSRIYLDSRDTALGFYKRLGFQPMTGVPCWIDVVALARQ